MQNEDLKFKRLRHRLVEEIKQKGIKDEAVLQAIEQVPRHLFMETAFSERAYEDNAQPIGENQTISQPYTVAYQTSLLHLKSGDKVLEIGTGSGYQCAVLCEMKLRVFSIERFRPLYLSAKKLLRELGYSASLTLGDGSRGWKQFQPYDGILVTAASPQIPPSLKEQLSIGGRLVIPVGNRESQTMVVVIRKSEDEYDLERYEQFRFVPLVGKEGWSDN